MAPLREVSRLYSLCTKRLFDILCSIFRVYDREFHVYCHEIDTFFDNPIKIKDLERAASSNRLEDGLMDLRYYMVENLNHSIRQDLIDLAAKVNSTLDLNNAKSYMNTSILLDFLLTLIDSRITKVDPAGGNESFTLNALQCQRLINILKDCKVTAVQELIMQVHFQSSHAKHQITPAVTRAFYSFAQIGVGSSLSKLVLHSICDNKTLELLGKHAVNLTYLDISRSWFVTDYGISKLLCEDFPWPVPQSNNKPCHDAMLRSLWNQTANSDLKLNPCSATLKEVRIQDTDTSVVAVGLLLRYVKNLQSLGGFIYYRNVGDVVWLFTKLSQGKERLDLSCLYDSHMPEPKALALAKALPNLSSLYTRAFWLPYLVSFPKLTTLTVDFDRRNCTDQLKSFFLSRPCQLRQLVICDEAVPLQLSLLAENCVNLEELQCTLAGTWKASQQRPLLPNLVTCRIFTKHRETVHAFLAYNNSLRDFQVCINGSDLNVNGMINDDTIRDAMKCRTTPPKLETVLFSATQPECDLSEASVMTLADACPELRRIGNLKQWRIYQRNGLVSTVRWRNLDLDISISGKPFFWSPRDS